jgi:hypothetical protein
VIDRPLRKADIALEYYLTLRRIPARFTGFDAASAPPAPDGLSVLGGFSWLRRDSSKGRHSSQALVDMAKEYHCGSVGTGYQVS